MTNTIDRDEHTAAATSANLPDAPTQDDYVGCADETWPVPTAETCARFEAWLREVGV